MTRGHFPMVMADLDLILDSATGVLVPRDPAEIVYDI